MSLLHKTIVAISHQTFACSFLALFLVSRIVLTHSCLRISESKVRLLIPSKEMFSDSPSVSAHVCSFRCALTALLFLLLPDAVVADCCYNQARALMARCGRAQGLQHDLLGCLHIFLRSTLVVSINSQRNVNSLQNGPQAKKKKMNSGFIGYSIDILVR